MIQLFLGIGLTIIWVVNLVNYDPKTDGCIPDKEECACCPLPCERNKH